MPSETHSILTSNFKAFLIPPSITNSFSFCLFASLLYSYHAALDICVLIYCLFVYPRICKTINVSDTQDLCVDGSAGPVIALCRKILFESLELT